MKKKQIKNWSLMIIMAMLLPLVSACADNKEIYAIEDALQLEWNISNSNSPVGVVGLCFSICYSNTIRSV